eukprot:TRINITY_DN25345_c0_g1_i1.p1 TRINITY_DN25345_c0_g1~~TRINITY_DN25345_c0_g1_i1.p1  ORF type:complete len:205 (+),score=58.56 TRINITY_DN25345_c0_g1_i1:54-668(+)
MSIPDQTTLAAVALALAAAAVLLRFVLPWAAERYRAWQGPALSELRLPVHVVLVLQDGNELRTADITRAVRLLGEHGIRFVTLYHTQAGVLDVEAVKAAAGPNTHISTACQADGKAAFLKMMRDAPAGEDITEEYITKHLPVFATTPDPDLLLVFGKCRCVYGFPPWPISVSEILFHTDVRACTAASLLDDFRHFSSVKVLKGV